MSRGPDIERLYDTHAPSLFAFLLNFTRNETDTRDLLQEIFVKLARDPDVLKNVRDERSFLLRLAHNVVLRKQGGVVDINQGDWVWKYPTE